MRRAIIDIDGENLAVFSAVLAEAGVQFVRSFDPAPFEYRGLRLGISGDCLPEECDESLVTKLVIVRFILDSKEVDGSVTKTVRLDRFEVIGPASARSA